jgi:hypothetical protein
LRKSGSVAVDEDPGSCDEAPGVIEGTCRGRDGGAAAREKISARSTRLGPERTDAFPAVALEVSTVEFGALEANNKECLLLYINSSMVVLCNCITVIGNIDAHVVL